MDTRVSNLDLQDAHGGPPKPGQRALTLEERTANFVNCGKYFESVILLSLLFFSKYSFIYLFIYLFIYFQYYFIIISYFNLSQVKGIGNHTAVAIQMNCRNFPILFKRCPEIKVRVATTDDVECIFSTARAKRRIHTAVTVLS